MFERAEAEWATRPTGEWLADYAHHIDNVRAALDWAFSPGGDSAVGIALTVAAEPLWTQLSLIDECRARVEQALASLDTEASRVRAAICSSSRRSARRCYTPTRAPDRTCAAIRSAYTAALGLAEKLDDTDHRLKALWGLWIDSFNSGEHRAALALARRFRSLAARSSEPADRPVGDRMVGFSLQLLGDLTDARKHTERMLDRYVAPVRRSHVIRFQFDQRITAQMTLAHILWLQGSPDRAMHTTETGVEEALALGHGMSLCNILAQAACPIALYRGELAAADRFIALLLDKAARHALHGWHRWGRCFQGLLRARSGDTAGGLEVFRTAFAELPPARFALRYTAFLGDLAETLCHAGRIAESVAAIDSALERSERHEELWCIAELLRIKAEILLQEGAPNATMASEQLFMRSLEWARRQGALSWELRTATSLARMWREQDRAVEALALLAPIHSRFSEGFATADLKAARNLLGTLQQSAAKPGSGR